MLSTWFAMNKTASYDVSMVITIVALLMIIDITLMIWAFYCLVDCHSQNLISLPMALILGFLLFVPAFGFIVPIGIIIYHSVYCKKHAIAATPKTEFMFF